MIVKRKWTKRDRGTQWTEIYREGWFLFGIIPLYVRDCNHRPAPKV